MQCAPQWRIATARRRLQVGEPGCLVGAFEPAATGIHGNVIRQAADVAVERIQAHADVAFKLRECLAGAGLGDLHAGAVIGIPGRIIDLLGGRITPRGRGSNHAGSPIDIVGAVVAAIPIVAAAGIRHAVRIVAIAHGAADDAPVRQDLETIVVAETGGRCRRGGILRHEEGLYLLPQVDGIGQRAGIPVCRTVGGAAGVAGPIGAHPRVVRHRRVVVDAVVDIGLVGKVVAQPYPHTVIVALRIPGVRHVMRHGDEVHRTGIVQDEHHVRRRVRPARLQRHVRNRDRPAGQRNKRGRAGQQHRQQAATMAPLPVSTRFVVGDVHRNVRHGTA